jgi:hypothetical protein
MGNCHVASFWNYRIPICLIDLGWANLLHFGGSSQLSPTSPPSRPGCSTNGNVVKTAHACKPQRPGTPAGAGGVYLSGWRRGPGLSYLLGRARLTLASPSATLGGGERWHLSNRLRSKKNPRSDRSTACVRRRRLSEGSALQSSQYS